MNQFMLPQVSMKARAICPRIDAPTLAAQEGRVGARTEFGGSGIGGIPVSWNPGPPHPSATSITVRNWRKLSVRQDGCSGLHVGNSHTRSTRTCSDVVCPRGPHEKTSRGLLLTQRARQWPVHAVGEQAPPIVVRAEQARERAVANGFAEPRDRVQNNTPEVLAVIGRHASDTAQATGVVENRRRRLSLWPCESGMWVCPSEAAWNHRETVHPRTPQCVRA